MGCSLSSAKNGGVSQGLAELICMVVFFPGLRLPSHSVDFSSIQGEHAPENILDQLSSCRARVVRLGIAVEGKATSLSKVRPQWKSFIQHGKNKVAELQQALEDYLLLMLNLTDEDSISTDALPFVWKNQEDTQLETSISEYHYEVLSVLHAMAVLYLFQANVLLAPNGHNTTTLEERRKQAIDVFLKTAGILECAMKIIMPKLSKKARSKLPVDLNEGLLHALSMQALGQSVQIQLGLAIDNLKATLAVKRRLACEQVKYLRKAHEDLQTLDVGGVWGGKHLLFLSWKLAEAKAAAFYFHGLILDEGSEEGTHGKAILCLETANGCLKESQNLCVKFCSAFPTTRSPPVWGAMMHLTERIPRDFSSKARTYRDAMQCEKLPSQVPELPDFPLSLHPEEFKLPGM